jgi:hypothetical protein
MNFSAGFFVAISLITGGIVWLTVRPTVPARYVPIALAGTLLLLVAPEFFKNGAGQEFFHQIWMPMMAGALAAESLLPRFVRWKNKIMAPLTVKQAKNKSERSPEEVEARAKRRALRAERKMEEAANLEMQDEGEPHDETASEGETKEKNE